MLSIAELKKLFDSEQVFVILLSRLYFKKIERDDIIQFLNNHSLNYEHLYSLSSIHGIRPFIYAIISSENIIIDFAYTKKLKEFYLYNQIRSMEQLSIASKTITELKEIGITAIPYKGVGLSNNYYDNIGLRESSDIDLLVDEKDVLKTENFLKDKAYAAKTTVTPTYWNYYRKNFKEISYTIPSKQGKYSVEIQWKLVNIHYGDYPDYTFFIKGLREQSIAELPFPQLEPVYDFMAICSNHLVKDLSTRFKYLVDISCLLNKHTEVLKNSLINEVAAKYKCRKRMEFGLYLIENLIGINTDARSAPHYKFRKDNLKFALENPIIKIKISDAGFMKRSLMMQDNTIEKLKFFIRCSITYPLPTAKEINTSKLSYPNIPLLVMRRLLQKGNMALNNLVGKHDTKL